MKRNQKTIEIPTILGISLAVFFGTILLITIKDVIKEETYIKENCGTFNGTNCDFYRCAANNQIKSFLEIEGITDSNYMNRYNQCIFKLNKQNECAP